MQDHLQIGVSIKYRPTSGEQAWRKRADLRVRLYGLRGEPGCSSSLRPESDSRQIDKADRQQKSRYKGLWHLLPRVPSVARLLAQRWAGGFNPFGVVPLSPPLNS